MKRKPSKYIRRYAVANVKGEILYSCRTGKRAEAIVDELNSKLEKNRVQVVELTKPLPKDVSDKYMNDEAYKTIDFIK